MTIASGARISMPGSMWRPGATKAHRHGHCLYKMGCKGPATSQNCPVVRWNEGTNWPIGCGHPCIGCAEPNFWDTMTPFYGRLPNVVGFDVGGWVDPVGLSLVGLAAAAP